MTTRPPIPTKEQPARRTLHPEVRVVSAAEGVVEYVASDETLDHYREVVRAAGWRFTHFAKNAPFVDSHNTSTIATVLGKVLDWRIEKDQLIERVQWARIPGTLAEWGFKMVEAGFLKAVSVGFYPTRYATKWDQDKSLWLQQLKELGRHEEEGINTVYIEQEQVELSACVLGANPNALARAYKAGALSDQDLDGIDQFLRRQIAGVSETRRVDSLDRGLESPPPPDRARRLALFTEIQKTLTNL